MEKCPVNIKVPVDLINFIDEFRSKTFTTRTSWILTAISEKVERDLNMIKNHKEPEENSGSLWKKPTEKKGF